MHTCVWDHISSKIHTQSLLDCELYHYWLTAHLLCPRFREAHVCQGVQGRQVLSVDLGWGWIFSRWQQCGHIAALQWFWLLVCWANGLALELTYWGLGLGPISGLTCLSPCHCILLRVYIPDLWGCESLGRGEWREWPESGADPGQVRESWTLVTGPS